ncbi:MAG: bifunctional ADP-dependent NAD(P)H-hydrate dehydratase/NAD(P)H-hydrate epimerase [Acidimicrobiales bacterium]|nr:MAG: bifunctional ADP-dependent NAD(P)H-hydrate dehydratase/NAD(P)H-hydrate epimerase [Acidimicrobiales bacterium]
MARAAYGLAHECIQLLRGYGHRLYGARVIVLAGSGNNGGDALYASAQLARRGAAVTAVLAADHQARVHSAALNALHAAGGRSVLASSQHGHALPCDAELIIDGLVGMGMVGALRGSAAELVQAAQVAKERGSLVVAADIPSGVNADTGEVDNPAATIDADVTVTFGCAKPGLLLAPGAHRAGALRVVPIGMENALTEHAIPVLVAGSGEEARRSWPRPQPDDDKYDRGVLGIAAGSTTYPGAALLAAGGALAGPIGALRCVIGQASSAAGILARYPEALVTPTFEATGRVQAWVVGPGLDTDDRAERTLRNVLGARLPTVIDGDALTLLARMIAGGFQLRAGAHGVSDAANPVAGAGIVLTPHRREFARLITALGKPGESEHPLAAARRLADFLGVTVLLKGARTLIVSPGEIPRVNLTGSPALATAGSGDVLAGLLGALLAAGCQPHAAAGIAAYVHGLAGQRAELNGTVTASALVRELPTVVARLVNPLRQLDTSCRKGTAGVSSPLRIVHT